MKKLLYSIDPFKFRDLRQVDIFLLSDSAEIKNWLKDKLRDNKYITAPAEEMMKDRIYFITNTKKDLLQR